MIGMYLITDHKMKLMNCSELFDCYDCVTIYIISSINSCWHTHKISWVTKVIVI